MSNDWRILAGLVAACCVAGIGPSAAQESGFNAGRNGLTYRSASGSVQATLGGRLHLDAASIDNGATSSDDEEVRRARLELSVKFADKWRLRIDREFTNGGGWRNVWVRYDLDDNLNIKAGNFIAPFSMEDVGSSNNTMFMERSLAQALAPGFGVGVAASYEGRHFGVSGGYFDDPIDAEDNIQAEKGHGFAVRGTWSPLERRESTLHFGLGLERREFDSASARRISSSPEASLAPTAVSTGAIANIDTSQSYNIEAAYSFGSVLIEGQHISTTLERSAGGDLTLTGGYAQIGWIVTGERYGYGDAAGVFSGPTPRRRWGAVELAARVSTLDLTEAGPNSGQADDVTAGANWYIGRNVRMMANYVHSEVDAVNPAFDRDTDVVEARLQFDF